MDNQLQIPQEVRAFLEGLLQDSGTGNLDSEMKEEMIKELYARLDSFLTSTIIKNMPAEHLEAFIKMNEEGKSKEEIENFLKTNMPNSQEVMTRAFMEFRDLYLGNVVVAKNAPKEQGEEVKTNSVN